MHGFFFKKKKPTYLTLHLNKAWKKTSEEVNKTRQPWDSLRGQNKQLDGGLAPILSHFSIENARLGRHFLWCYT